MSSMSLEERRAERRRKRQMEEETSRNGTKSADEIHADIQERLARRRKERDDRIASLATSVATVNGEDDLERRRRERREQRLRASGDTDYTSTDDYSSRRNRRRGTDDNTSEDTSSYSSSRRHRNWDDEETPTVNAEPISSVPDSSEEDRRRQREEEEEEARRQAEREAEEEGQRRAALEEEKRREEEARKQAEEEQQRQEEARRLAEEERQRQEEEDRRRDEGAEFESESEGSSGEDNYRQNKTENKLFIEEDDLGATDVPVEKFECVRQVNGEANHVDYVERQNSDNIWSKNGNVEKSKSVERSGSFKEINNNKIKDKLNKFEHLKYESDTKTVNAKSVMMIPLAEKDGLKGKLQMFEKEIKEQEILAKELHKQPSGAGKKEVSTPQPQRLTEKLQQFETAARSQTASKPSSINIQFELANIGGARRQRQSMLGRWSVSESHINKTDSKGVPKRNVLDRWKSVDKQQQQTPNVMSPTEKKEQLNKRLSGNTEFIASKYLEKASKSVEEPHTPNTPVSSLQKTSFTQSLDQRNTSHSSETQSDISEDVSSNQSRTKVASRWPFTETQSEIVEDVSSNQSRAKVASRWPFTETQSEISKEAPVKQSKAKVTKRWPFNEENENTISTPKHGLSVIHPRGIHSRESSSDNTQSISRGSSIDLSDQSNWAHQKAQREVYTIFSRKKKKKKRDLDKQKLRFQEARMAAEDGQKKRTKRKGLGGLTPEKKKKLKQIIMQKAAEDLKKEALAKAQEKEKFINDRVGLISTDGLGEAELRKLIKSLHEKLAQIHSEAYDIEFKLNKQEKELVDLNMKISDSRGKFAKPVLRKVNKTEQKFAKMTKQAEAKADFRETLLSAQDDKK